MVTLKTLLVNTPQALRERFIGIDLTGWFWAGLIERISLDQRSRG
jgi:hypothetical protein